MGILHYESLDRFGQEYKPKYGYPQILKRKVSFGVEVVITLIAYESYALAYRQKTKTGHYVGKVMVCDDLNKLLPIYNNL